MSLHTQPTLGRYGGYGVCLVRVNSCSDDFSWTHISISKYLVKYRESGPISTFFFKRVQCTLYVNTLDPFPFSSVLICSKVFVFIRISHGADRVAHDTNKSNWYRCHCHIILRRWDASPFFLTFTSMLTF